MIPTTTPKQNRVTPFGEIIATPERGSFMGNRGVLHDAEGHVTRPWQVKRWLVCVLEFRGRKRTVMAPGRYTELFFLDEATALAVGHRPCAECRRQRFNDFCAAWATGNKRSGSSAWPTAARIDEQLHAERIGSDGSKCTFLEDMGDLPDGVFVQSAGCGQHPYLLWRHGLFAWSLGGYREARPRPRRGKVRVLTPKSTVAAIRAGYVPEVHVSGGRV
jgi:hypothetical protein